MSAWGNSWGMAWGNSWGAVESAAPDEPTAGGGLKALRARQAQVQQRNNEILTIVAAIVVSGVLER